MNKMYILATALAVTFVGCSSSSSSDSSSSDYKEIKTIEEAENTAMTFQLTTVGLEDGGVVTPTSMINSFSNLLVSTQSDTYTCSNGGTVTVSGTQYNYTANFNNCDDFGIIYNGDQTTQIQETATEAQITMKSTSLTAQSVGLTIDYDNTIMTLKTDLDYNPITVSMDGTFTYDMNYPYNTSATLVYDNMFVTYIAYENDFKYLVDGEVEIKATDYSCIHGKYIYTTIDGVGSSNGTIKINDVIFEYYGFSAADVTFADGTQKRINISNEITCSN